MRQIKIVCPKCKTPLTVSNPQERPEVLINCPECQTRLRVKFPAGGDDPQTTILKPRSKSDLSPGFIMFNRNRYPLQIGENTVGRSSSTAQATVQIPTDDRTMSRLHARIEVVRLNSGGVKAILSNIPKKHENPTYLCGECLLDFERVVLEDGDDIKMGNTSIIYCN